MTAVIMPPIRNEIWRGERLEKSFDGETTLAAMFVEICAITTITIASTSSTGRSASSRATSVTGSQIASPNSIDRRRGHGDADEREAGHRQRHRDALADDLRALVLRVAGEVGDVHRQRDPVADVGREAGAEQRPEALVVGDQLRRGREDVADPAARVEAPDQQRDARAEQQRRGVALEELDALDAAQDDRHLDQPEDAERDRLVAADVGPAGRQRGHQRVERERADPGLDPEPAARDERPRHRRDVRAADAEARAHEHRERDAVLRARVRVEQDRDQHDQVAQRDGQQPLPPASCRPRSGPTRACRS